MRVRRLPCTSVMDIRAYFSPAEGNDRPNTCESEVPMSSESEEDNGTDAFHADCSGLSSSSSSSNRGTQVSGFKKSWLKGRQHWLVFDKGMYCKPCIKHNKRPFNRDTWNLTPCTRYRLHSVLSHEKCSAHQDSVKLEAAACASVNICQAIQLPLVPARGLEQAFS